MVELKVMSGREILTMNKNSTIWNDLCEVIKKEEKQISPKLSYGIKILINKRGHIFQIIYVGRI